MSKKSNEQITCIYCKQASPPSKEHAVQRNLGGNLTIPDVCRTCNTSFSKIDKALAERSLLSMIRVVEQTTDAEKVLLGGTNYYTPPGGETLEVDVGFRMKAKPKPQLMFKSMADKVEMRGGGESIEDYQSLIRVIREYITSGKIDSTPILPGPIDQPSYTLPRLVLHRDSDLFFRAPSSLAEPEKFLAAVVGFLKKDIDKLDAGMKASLETAAVQSDPTPQVMVTNSINFNDIFRAVAKNTFNILAFKEGASFVLRSEFDPIRDYIRGTDIRNVEPSSSDTVAYDHRFVRMTKDEDKKQFIIPGENFGAHTCLIMYSYPNLYSCISFYGRQSYIVQFGEVKLQENVMHVHVFDYVEKSNRSLSLDEIAQSIREQLTKKPL